MRVVRRVLAVAFLLAGIVWAGDALLLRHKIARQEAYGEVTVHQRFAVRLKNRQLDYRSVKPFQEECVRSIFPHEGESACWYLERYSDRMEEIDSGQYHFWPQ
jgi:hypothetical protein